MQHLTTNLDLLKSLDIGPVQHWLEAHSIDTAWITLDQTIDFEPGYVAYTQYRHLPDGTIVYDRTRPSTELVPYMDRITHRCTLRCRDTSAMLEDLVDYEVKEDDDSDGDS